MATSHSDTSNLKIVLKNASKCPFYVPLTYYEHIAYIVHVCFKVNIFGFSYSNEVSYYYIA